MALAECLLDQEVRFNVAGQGASKECFPLIMETTGAQPEAIEAADFLFLFGTGSDKALQQAKRGTPETSIIPLQESSCCHTPTSFLSQAPEKAHASTGSASGVSQ